MGALADEQRRYLTDEEIRDAIRAWLRVPPEAEVIFQIDGTALVVWNSK